MYYNTFNIWNILMFVVSFLVSDRIRSAKCCSLTARPVHRDHRHRRRQAEANRQRRPGNGPLTRQWESTLALWATIRRAMRRSMKGAAPSLACPRASAGPGTADESTGTRVTVSI